MLRTTLRRVQLSPRSAVSPFVCIFCQKKGPNLERRLTTKDVGQSNSVEPPPTKTSASSLKKSESVMDILRKDLLERKEGRSRKKSAKKAKAAEKKESKKAKAAEKKEPKKSKGKKKGVSLFQAEAAVARSPKKKKALQVCLLSLLFMQAERCVANFAQRARGSTMPGLSISEAIEEKVGDKYKYEILDPRSREIERMIISGSFLSPSPPFFLMGLC